jgi:predicted porin
MQKKLLTMAVASALAAPVAALADVSVYGSIDTGIKQQSKVWSAAGTEESRLTVEGQQKKTNRWGFKGSEDLGGGLMANFTLEGGYDSDTGQMGATGSGAGLFGRYAVVGLSKGGNKIDLGKDYTLNFRTHGIYDPLSHDYGGAAGVQGNITAGTRTNNSIMAAFRFGAGGVAVQYAPGEEAGDNGSGSYRAVNGDMAFGPATIGVAWGSREAVAPATTDTTTINVGGAYKMGAFTFRLGLSTETIDTSNESQKLSGGVQYDFSPTLTGRVSLYDFTVENSGGTEIGSARTLVVNMEYSLSKRTLVYFVFDRKTLDGNQNTGVTVNASLRDGATGIGAGLVHNF